MKKVQKLTTWEWEALVSNSNLADGHAHQAQNTLQKNIIKNLSTIYKRSEEESQETLQSDFEKIFFKKAGQHSYKKLRPPQYHYACSISIEVVANFLRLSNKSLSLIHPTFDNLPDIFRRHRVNLNAIEEIDLINPEKLKRISTEALMIVCPNNPTGQELTKKQFENIVHICKQKNIILIMDFSFRFYSSFIVWDQYKILLDSGVDFIILEDTGKTFPTVDLKMGILLSSNSLYEKLQDITNDFLLNVSPFIFVLLTEFLKAENGKKVYSFQEAINKNRILLIKLFESTPFIIENKSSNISVAWVKLPEGEKSRDLCSWLEKKGIFILPGAPFFWNDLKRGDAYFRVALARPIDFFERVASRLAIECNEYLSLPRNS